MNEPDKTGIRVTIEKDPDIDQSVQLNENQFEVSYIDNPEPFALISEGIRMLRMREER